MKKILVVVFLFTFCGCASLQNAGTAHYSVKPFVTNHTTGEMSCCEVVVDNGKEISSLVAHIEKRGNDYTVDLNEQGVKAFEGQAIASGALKEAIDGAVKAAVTTALAPFIPALAPALVAPGIAAAALGAGAVVGGEKLLK